MDSFVKSVHDGKNGHAGVLTILLDILPKDRSGWRQALWLYQRHGQLDGKRPADVFKNNPESVIKAARSDFELNDERW